MDDVQFAWEYSKENVLPLKRGRDTKKLNNILGARKSEREEHLASEQRCALRVLWHVAA